MKMPMALGLLYRIYEHNLVAHLDPERRPRHIGVVLDGHRRHARAEGLASYADSYREGMSRFEEFLGWADDLKIPAVTAWVLSPENLSRPAEELGPYFEVLIDLFERLPEECVEYDMALKFIGSLDLLPRHLVEAAKTAEEKVSLARPETMEPSSKNPHPGGSRRLNIAMGYGGRQEIVDAAKDLVSNLVEEGVPSDEMADRIDAESLAAHMYSADLPDADLIIRTSGESRLSGFLLWQSAYSEFVFVDVNWPAFRRVDFLRALRDYEGRSRRFGQ
jgi:short-chain Z-isoprenyl diphosphate synthase